MPTCSAPQVSTRKIRLAAGTKSRVPRRRSRRTGKSGVFVDAVQDLTGEWIWQGLVRSNGGQVLSDDRKALTFAEQVVVMIDGQVVQAGTPVELFERPRHTFVGHFIGSPGMNILPCEVDSVGVARFAGQAVPVASSGPKQAQGKKTEIGVRPEFVRFTDDGLPVQVERVSDIGRFRIVDARSGEHIIKALIAEGQSVPTERGHLSFDPSRTQLYADGWIVD